MSDPFGFATANRVAAKIAEIRPETEKTTEPPLAAIDKAADQLGFRSREASSPRSCAGVGRSARRAIERQMPYSGLQQVHPIL